ncbi:hypothetical protein M3G43_16070 [Brevibacterium casei]|uniref:hypothetical protein n=1 Tax=Brevibacterium casei TaxID=33889 RepID=UPI00223B23E8|nr:hypothetical protein [Brevibacterium casei]MCT1448772.1 hypothetical protein [Brevibacterium casei]
MAPGSAQRPLARRRLLTGALTGAGLFGIGLAAPGLPARIESLKKSDPVRSVAAAYVSDSERAALSSAAARDLPPRSRVLPGTGTRAAAERERDFLAVAVPWLAKVPERLVDLAVSALLDLWILSDDLPGPVASWSGAWRYIWPRDTAFVAAALAAVGHAELAWGQLRHLQALQGEDGWFAARYDPETGSVPDDRAPQLDAVGLVLWSIAEVGAASEPETPAPAPARSLSELEPMIDRSAALLDELTGSGRTLPPVSPDYWEVGEGRITLGIAAPTLIGLRALTSLGDAGTAERLGERTAVAEAFTETFARTFGAGGLQRYPSSGGFDSAAAYLPASGMGPDLVDAAALDRMGERLRQPAGGIRPGTGWILDDASWTPSTSLLALGYARLGESARAEAVLDWLAGHRTASGSLPEKVDGEGTPVSVAPLAWTAANVVLALDALRG